jgi:hypothetical protein
MRSISGQRRLWSGVDGPSGVAADTFGRIVLRALPTPRQDLTRRRAIPAIAVVASSRRRRCPKRSTTGEPVAGKTGTAGSGRWPLEKDHHDTSPAVHRYGTCWAVRRCGDSVEA